MKIITTVKEMQAEADRLIRAGKVIGFVPTMGYLHEGHLSLIRIARKQANVVVLSIYVNPTQFAPHEDLEKYPRDFERDEQLAEREGVDLIFYPSDEEMYPEDYSTYVRVEKLTETLCGRSRPDHFQGVTTICAKLFHAVKPHLAVFGQKDAQQAVVIRRMVKDLDWDMEIIVGPIVREKDGLAMSSRNSYLSSEERREALSLHQSLQIAEEMIRKGERKSETILTAMRNHLNEKKRIRTDYIEIVHSETLQPLETIGNNTLIALAAFVGKTRLIDNTIIKF
ncbi:pantoate--beta-alanine ligase [bacterium]|nr:pantoate--beta-alanine ligase [bacterium]RQV94727.1 MAG: pantoate--beta-alanine ligase [bacterium]